MAGRFRNPTGHQIQAETRSSRGDGFGEWWAAIAVIAVSATAIVALMGSSDPSAESPNRRDPTREVLAPLSPAQHELDRIEFAFEALCREPVLLALELEPDCETGVITLSDKLFENGGSGKLGKVAREDVAAAMTTYLARLRRLPALWDSLDAIEIRGHNDPRAVRDPYETNMVGSQQRALGVLIFLVGPDGVSQADQRDLERLAVVSGASFARPPASCPDRSRGCYADWRRVEIRPVLSESLRRGDWSRPLRDVRSATTPNTPESGHELR